MKRRNALAAGIALALIAGSASAGNDFDYCLLCHGTNANGNYGIRAPKLSGMEPWYLARQLENFASGARGTPAEDAPGHEMGPVGMRLKAEGTLDAAVQFIGKLDSKRPAPTITGDVAHGKKLYENCASCHGAKGEGNASLNSPALAARSDWYLVAQLVNYQKGLRGTDERDTYGAQMRAIVTTLPDEKAIKDVVAYINTL
ncbi:MAG TPA: c-type cytochrome [Steroidobacteraceae bacterium]|nr:c-type cytochrome [Steroidobacteraceae bacterium]